METLEPAAVCGSDACHVMVVTARMEGAASLQAPRARPVANLWLTSALYKGKCVDDRRAAA